MIGRVEMEELRNLQDSDKVKGKNGKIFNFMFKKNKISRIKFETNSKNVSIFPLSEEGNLKSAKF